MSLPANQGAEPRTRTPNRAAGSAVRGATRHLEREASGWLDQALHFDQLKLAELCEDRPLRTSEIHASNDYYGQASVLKRYAGLPDWYPLKVVLEHAPMHHELMWEADGRALLGTHLCCNGEREPVLERLTGKTVIPIGFGYLYAMKLVDEAFGPPRPPQQRRGTLVFPYKSTPRIKTEFDHADYAARLAALPAEMQPVTVCMFWRGYQAGTHLPYQEQGLPVVTAGHAYDKDFFLRLHDICRCFKYAASNGFGSQLFFSVASGCGFFYLSSSPINWQIEKSDRERRDHPRYLEIKERSWRLFEEPRAAITDEQRAFVDLTLGTEFARSRKQLRRLLLAAELRDKFVPCELHVSEERIRRATPFGARLGGRVRTLRRAIKRRLRSP